MTTNPIMIASQYNEKMKRWDVVLMVGNFASQKEAQKASKFLQELVERELGSKRVLQS